MAQRARREGRDRQEPRSGDASGRNAKGLPEDRAKVVRAREAALLCDVLHGVFASLDQTHGHYQMQAVELLARRDPVRLLEERGRVETAQPRRFRHLRDHDGASVVLPTEILDPIDERSLDKPGSPGLRSSGGLSFDSSMRIARPNQRPRKFISQVMAGRMVPLLCMIPEFVSQVAPTM
jgi:hypothetical protein